MLFLFLSFLYIFFSFSYTLIIEDTEQSSNVSVDQYEFTNRNAKSNYVQITNTKFLLPYNITPCTHDADYYCDLFVLRG